MVPKAPTLEGDPQRWLDGGPWGRIDFLWREMAAVGGRGGEHPEFAMHCSSKLPVRRAGGGMSEPTTTGGLVRRATRQANDESFHGSAIRRPLVTRLSGQQSLAPGSSQCCPPPLSAGYLSVHAWLIDIVVTQTALLNAETCDLAGGLRRLKASDRSGPSCSPHFLYSSAADVQEHDNQPCLSPHVVGGMAACNVCSRFATPARHPLLCRAPSNRRRAQGN